MVDSNETKTGAPQVCPAIVLTPYKDTQEVSGENYTPRVQSSKEASENDILISADF